jgi:hypothetical protein
MHTWFFHGLIIFSVMLRYDAPAPLRCTTVFYHGERKKTKLNSWAIHNAAAKTMHCADGSPDSKAILRV